MSDYLRLVKSAEMQQLQGCEAAQTTYCLPARTKLSKLSIRSQLASWKTDPAWQAVRAGLEGTTYEVLPGPCSQPDDNGICCSGLVCL